MDGSESPRAGTLLGLVGARAVGALGAGENAAGSDQEDVAVGELLLELTGEAGGISIDVAYRWGESLPLLHLVPALEKGNRDEDDNGLASVTDLDLRILVSAKLPSAHRLFVQQCGVVCMRRLRRPRAHRGRCWCRCVCRGNCFILPRERTRTGEGAESSSGRGCCSGGPRGHC